MCAKFYPSLIIPAYNEEKRIADKIQSLIKHFDGAFEEYELIIIADGCTDGTPEIVSKYVNDNSKIKLLIFPERLGKGGAIIEGLKEAKGNVIVITDADNSVAPKELLNLIRESNEYDMVIGSRYMRDSKLLAKEPLLRYLLGRSFNALTKLMFWGMKKYNDTQCGAKVLKKHVAEEILGELFITGFAIDVNLIYSAVRRGFKVKEVPITYTHMERGSKISRALTKVVIGMFFSLIKLRLYYSRFRFILNTNIMKKISSALWKLTKV
jgi:glycosyltransferase involved in cell wall biosynthesis